MGVDWPATIVAAIAAMIIGAVWYSKPVFAKAWMGYIGKTEDQLREGGNFGMVVAVFASVVTAIVLNYVIEWAGSTDFVSGMLAGATLWLGFSVAETLMNDAFEQRPWGLTLLNSGNRLLTLMVMSGIIAQMR